ncbi:UNVERIFIED_CONTAM: BTB/POZ domain-containing protein [Sesamum latifolium]|uniref:BTB/POZ domain-containing protein n=1 Tax=Sesamum latifolium TaxID=2727402 RepID=A0AAW2WZ15_9LAMI
MKFMKLGSRPDTFYTTEAVRSVSSEVSSDLIIQVKGSRYLLHKFPLLSKCLRLQKLCSETSESSQLQLVQLHDFPAEYLQMTEEAEKGNLIYKLEVFFNSCILHGWRDIIVTLQSTKAFPLWSEDLGITVSRRGRDDVSCNGSESHRHKPTTSKGWWGEDLAELGIDLYWRTMIAIKSGGKVPTNLIGDALRIYASQWLPNISKYIEKQDESDSELGEAANILKASSSTKTELARRVGLQLEEATLGDLGRALLQALQETRGNSKGKDPEAIPEFARLDHDNLYKAIDIYLKGHPELNKSERKRLCRILDCKKLSVEACMHAAQNEMLPLRVVVQVLFFEQARAAMAGGGQTAELPSNIKALLAGHKTQSKATASTIPSEDQWSVSGLKSPKSNLSTLKMKLAEDDGLDDNFPDETQKSSTKTKSVSMIPNRPKRMFSKLWPINRSASEKN